MSGYTEPTLINLEHSGERPRVLLFDGRHVEAIVTGRIPPADMIRAALKVAGFTGRIHVCPDDLRAVIERGGTTSPTGPGEYPALAPPAPRRASRRRFRRGPKAGARTGVVVSLLAVAIAQQCCWSYPAARIPSPPARGPQRG
jgi:hypothetical protein